MQLQYIMLPEFCDFQAMDDQKPAAGRYLCSHICHQVLSIVIQHNQKKKKNL